MTRWCKALAELWLLLAVLAGLVLLLAVLAVLAVLLLLAVLAVLLLLAVLLAVLPRRQLWRRASERGRCACVCAV